MAREHISLQCRWVEKPGRFALLVMILISAISVGAELSRSTAADAQAQLQSAGSGLSAAAE